MWHVWGTGEVHTGFRWGDAREAGHLEDLGSRWEDDIKMDLQAVELGCMEWIDLAQNMDKWWTLVNVVMNLWVP